MITFQQFLTQILRVRCQETRMRTADYLEVVMSKTDLEKLLPSLEEYFGPPMKAEGQPVSGDADRYSMPYGGIRANQTLYCKKGEEGFEVAMIWPWSNGVSVTVKIIREQKEVPVEKKKSFLERLFGK